MVLNFQKDISLSAYNTFGIDVKSKNFISIQSTDVLKAVLSENQDGQLLVLGGGSNVLFSKDYKGTIVHISIKGKKKGVTLCTD